MMVLSLRSSGIRLAAIVALLIVIGSIAPVSRADERILPDEVNAYIHWLALDEDQQAIVQQLFADYEQTFEAEYLSALNEFITKRNAVHAEADPPGAPSRAVWDRLENEAEQLRAQRERIEANFFAQIESILRDDEQREKMTRVRLGRERFLWCATEAELPEGNVDLIEMIETFERQADPPLSPETKRKIADIIKEFEPAFVEALRAAARARLQAQPLAHEGIRIGRASEQTNDPAQRQALLDRYAELSREFGRVRYDRAWQLVELNRRMLGGIRAVLPTDASEQFHQRFLAQAYPEVHPDPVHALWVFDEALAIGSIEPLVRRQTEHLRQQFVDRHEFLSREMRKAVLERRIATLRNAPGDDTVATEAWSRLLTNGGQREHLNVSSVARVRVMVGTGLAGLLSPWKYDTEPIPRPWDPRGDRARAFEQQQRERERRMEELERRRRGGGG